MAIFHLIRHGHHDWLQRGYPGHLPGVNLSEQGVIDAERVTEWLANLPITMIVSSPLERAQQTAAPLAQRLNLPIQIEEGFIEYDFGDWSGMSFDELHAQPGWITWQTTRSLCCPPNGESIVDVQARVLRLLARLNHNYPDAEIAMYGHGDPIKTALSYGLGTQLDNVTKINVDPASVSTLDFSAEGVRVRRVNRVV